MPGVVFLINIPTANYENALIQGLNISRTTPDTDEDVMHGKTTAVPPPPLPPKSVPQNNKLNINLPESNVSNTVLRLEVELRDKHSSPSPLTPSRRAGPLKPRTLQQQQQYDNKIAKDDLSKFIVPMEKIVDELLKKLEIEHVIWSSDKNGNYYQIIFPLQSGDSCETTLHCLTELGIGTKLNSTVSVLPCSVSYDATVDNSEEELYRNQDYEANSKWENFVDSIRSKLTVKQVVDGVRAGGALSFDYLLLIVTADSLAALGLVENNAPNIVAAMLVSPLMGPVMSITFGAIISDRELMRVGLISLGLGMFISVLFGFVFGLILGTTEQPWGFGDFPTEEMKGRGNVRSLWMGVLWALTSGSGVAVALLQGSAGPLIGVAISASLLPPVVNCGLFWALGCIWLIYDGVKIPHIKGEPYTGNSSYVPIYTNHIPTEFFINGIVSAMLTVVNVICIFITAIIVLKIKEVAAPYTSTPDLRRFWETDIRTVRKTNRSTIRRRNTNKDDMFKSFEDINYPTANTKNIETTLEQALKEAVNNETFRKVKRISYSSNAANEISEHLALSSNNNNSTSLGISPGAGVIGNGNVRDSRLNTDFVLLDRLVTSLLESQNYYRQQGPSSSTPLYNEDRSTPILNRLRPLSRSLRMETLKRSVQNNNSSGSPTNSISTMPTIMESGNSSNRTSSWSSDKARKILNSIANAPKRISQTVTGGSNANAEEEINLTPNIMN